MRKLLNGKKGDEGHPLPFTIGLIIVVLTVIVILALVFQAKGVLDVSSVFAAGRG